MGSMWGEVTGVRYCKDGKAATKVRPCPEDQGWKAETTDPRSFLGWIILGWVLGFFLLTAAVTFLCLLWVLLRYCEPMCIEPGTHFPMTGALTKRTLPSSPSGYTVASLEVVPTTQSLLAKVRRTLPQIGRLATIPPRRWPTMTESPCLVRGTTRVTPAPLLQQLHPREPQGRSASMEWGMVPWWTSARAMKVTLIPTQVLWSLTPTQVPWSHNP